MGVCYAFRKGKHVNNCIFFIWDDAKSHIENYESAEYKVFDDLGEGAKWINANVDGKRLETIDSSKSVDECLQNTLWPKDNFNENEKFENKTEYEKKQNRKPSKKWETKFLQVKVYKAETGSFHIDIKDTSNLPLKRWMNIQRHQYNCFQSGKENYINEEKIRRLEQIGFDFTLHAFDQHIEQLAKFQEEQGYSNSTHHDSPLGKWVEKQKQQLKLFHERKFSSLTSKQVNRLETLGIIVETYEKNKNTMVTQRPESEEKARQWGEMFNNLKKYKEKVGHTQVPKGDSDEALCKWVYSQRLEYKKLKLGDATRLTAVRLQKLNDVGFVFSPRPRYLKWEERIDQLHEFKNKNGHLRVPVTHPDIGDFIAKQRVEYAKFKEGKPTVGMNDERIEQLKDLGFVFQVGKRRTNEIRPPNKTWDERFNDLLQFKESEGHTRVPQSNSGLGEWVHKQRKNYKKLKNGIQSSLTTERALRLADIGFVFNASAYRRKRKNTNETEQLVSTKENDLSKFLNPSCYSHS